MEFFCCVVEMDCKKMNVAHDELKYDSFCNFLFWKTRNTFDFKNRNICGLPWNYAHLNFDGMNN